jgi:rod shape determining protein RodA
VNPLAALLDFFLDWRGRLGQTRALLLGLALLLTVLGIAFVHSTTSLPDDPFPSRMAMDQIRKAAVGLGLMLFVISIDYRLIERCAYVIYAVLIAVLGGLLVWKRLTGEDLIRWIQIGSLWIQPSEPMKIVLILALARYLKFRTDMRKLSGLVVPFGITLVPFILIVAQPNLGTAMMLLPILLAALFLSGARRTHLAVAVLAGILVFPAIILAIYYLPGVSNIILEPYQQKRFIAYIERDPANAYQLQQAQIAFQAGGLSGKGYHGGPQNNLGYLPKRHTDFIFAVVGEELGFLGAAGLAVAFYVLVVLCLRVAIHTREPFGRLVAVSVAVAFGFQGSENMCMNLGLTPITGVPLPFVSHGGSSLVASFIALGLVLNVAFRRVRVVASQDFVAAEEAEVMLVVDDHPDGAQRFPGR